MSRFATMRTKGIATQSGNPYGAAGSLFLWKTGALAYHVWQPQSLRRSCPSRIGRLHPNMNGT
jgi:hypothetical protein